MTEKQRAYFKKHAHERYMTLREQNRCVQCTNQDERTLAGYCRCEECSTKGNEYQRRRAAAKANTNFRRIKKMSVDEMAEFLMNFVTEALTNPKCIVVKKWLESEVQSDDR